MNAEERDRRAFEIFTEACALPPPQRALRVEHACVGDAELRRRVEALLKADAREQVPIGSDPGDIDSFLSRHVQRVLPDIDAIDRTDAAPVADTEYTILRVIGEGGMGTVYEAEQHSPRRRVAIKAIRPGYITPQMRKRFEYEAQVLARLEHAGIARLYEFVTQNDAGRIRAYLAM